MIELTIGITEMNGGMMIKAHGRGEATLKEVEYADFIRRLLNKAFDEMGKSGFTVTSNVPMPPTSNARTS
jgi:hypothetical protein